MIAQSTLAKYWDMLKSVLYPRREPDGFYSRAEIRKFGQMIAYFAIFNFIALIIAIIGGIYLW